MFDDKTLAERDGDRAILVWFREWLEIRRESAALCREADVKDAVRRAEAREQAIFGMAARGAAGLAVKAYLVAWKERADELILIDLSGSLDTLKTDYDSDEVLWPSEQALRSLLADAARFAPELAPVVARFIDAPLTLPPPPDEARKAELRERCEALAAEYPVDDLPETDAGLIEAERRLREFQEREKALHREFDVTMEVEEEIVNPSLDPPMNKLIDFIEETEPETMIGVALKLRHTAYDGCDAETVIKQCLPIIGRQAEREARR
ncbi:MAG: hypothetical protein ACREE4_03820 [Stellaceae bacterium]